MKKIILGILVCLFLLSFPCTTYAHPGKTDSDGGHYDHQNGEYHYHHGYPAHDHIDNDCPYDFDDQTDHTPNQSYDDTINDNTDDITNSYTQNNSNYWEQRLEEFEREQENKTTTQNTSQQKTKESLGSQLSLFLITLIESVIFFSLGIVLVMYVYQFLPEKFKKITPFLLIIIGVGAVILSLVTDCFFK